MIIKSFVDRQRSASVLPVLMAWQLRIQHAGASFHIMNRGGSRQKVCFDKQDYVAFLNTMVEVYEGWSVDVFACLMASAIMCVCARSRERRRRQNQAGQSSQSRRTATNGKSRKPWLSESDRFFCPPDT